MAKLKYLDHRSMTFLVKHPKGGVSPKAGDVIDVNEDEKRSLLKMKNGKTPMFEEISTRKRVEAKRDQETSSSVELGGN